MTVSLKHAFTSPVADESDPNEVGPDEWNDEHILTLSGDRILGRLSTDGAAQELTATQVRTLLNVADGATAYTDEQAQDAVGGILSSDFVYDDDDPSIALASAAITGKDEKTTPHDDDEVLLSDSEDGGTLKRLKVGNFPSGAGGGFFHDTFEVVTTDNATPYEFDPSVFQTRVTSDGSNLEQSITLPTVAATDSGLLHLIVLVDQSAFGDVIRVTGAIPADFKIENESGFALLQVVQDGQWAVVVGNGSWDVADLFSTFPRVPSISFNGNFSYLEPSQYKPFFQSSENVTISGGSADANTDVFLSNITSDGSGTSQTINLPSLDFAESVGLYHLFKLDSQEDDGDKVVIVADDGIVGGEVITLEGPSSAFALFQLTADGWLPITFGEGATTNISVPRTLQLKPDGALRWFASEPYGFLSVTEGADSFSGTGAAGS